MQTVLIVFHVLLAAALIGVVLLQRGAGATAGAAFGAGASGTVFGARGSANFLTRTTTGLAIGFFGISLTMAVLAARGGPGPADDDLGFLAPAPRAVETMTIETQPTAGETDFADVPVVAPEDAVADDAPATDERLPEEES